MPLDAITKRHIAAVAERVMFFYHRERLIGLEQLEVLVFYFHRSPECRQPFLTRLLLILLFGKVFHARFHELEVAVIV